WNQQAADNTAQVCKALKVIACLTLYIPVAVLYRIADLYGRVTQNDELNTQEARINLTGNGILQNEPARLPKKIDLVRLYPGDLTFEEKNNISPNPID